MDRTPLARLLHYMEQENFRGYDPYDALNSPILRALAFGQKSLRILFIQLLKRLPVNLRPALFIQKGCNPKGLGLFLWGYAKLYVREKESHYLEQISKLLDLLDRCKTQTTLDSRFRGNDRIGHGWGYNFDWQSRAFFVPKYTPTVVNSAFIGHALLDTWHLTDNRRAMDMALPIGEFILRHLNRHEADGALCFSYTPLDRYFVHNANLLAASLLIRLYAETGESACRDAGLAALAYSMRRQRPDGAWYYAEKEGSHWIDSFHTGFNLQAIRYFLDIGWGEEWREGYDQGVRFYAENFFLEDGTPKYYHDRIWPIDIHSPAQAVVFFPEWGRHTRR